MAYKSFWVLPGSHLPLISFPGKVNLLIYLHFSDFCLPLNPSCGPLKYQTIHKVDSETYSRTTGFEWLVAETENYNLERVKNWL